MIHETYTLRTGETITIPIAQTYKDALVLIKSDMYRVGVGRVLSFMRNPLFWLRMASVTKSSLGGVIVHKLIRRKYIAVSKKYNIQMPPETKIGYGLYIGHGICMVVNEGTVIGNNVNLSQFLNIGTNHNTPAIIGDNVYIGPSVCVVENVHIGSNTTIGAGSVVTKDIPRNATAAGVPAKVLNYDNPARYISQKWETEF